MRLRAKTLLVLALAGTALTAGWAALSWLVIDHRFAGLEREALAMQSARLRDLVAQQRQFLADKVSDWAAWDDSFRFVEDRNEAFKTSNLLPETVRNMRLAGIVYADLEGRIFAEVGDGPIPRIDLGAGSPLLARLVRGEAVAGLVPTGDGYALVAAGPVRRSDGSGEPRGAVLFLRRFDEHLAIDLEQIMGRPTAFTGWPGGVSERIAPRADGRIDAVVAIDGIDGRPLLQGVITEERTLRELGRRTWHLVAIGGALASLALGLFAAIAIDRVVVRRMSALSARLGPAAAAGGDEIDELERTATSAVERARDAEAAAKAGQRRYLALFDASADAVLVVERGRIVEANAAAALLIGVAAPSDLAGEDYLALIPLDRNGPRHPSSDSITAGVRDAKLRARDGRELELRVHEARVGVDGHDLLQVVLHDRTAARERERRLAEAKTEAERTAAAKQAFLAMASHELRTPLNGVVGMAGLLAAGELTGTQRDQVGVIKVCADTLLALINDILDLTRLEAGSVQLEQAAFDPRDLADDAAAVVAAAGAGAGAIAVFAAPDLPRVVGDGGRFRQIIINIAAQAARHARGGDIRIALSAQPSGLGVRLGIEVSDAGPGYEPGAVDGLFEPFTVRAGGVPMRHGQGGTGLGLAIVRRLVHLMGGQVAVQSVFGRGATFLVSLQLAESDDQPTTARYRGLTATVHDRRPLVREATTALLIALGAEVLPAGSPAVPAVAVVGDAPDPVPPPAVVVRLAEPGAHAEAGERLALPLRARDLAAALDRLLPQRRGPVTAGIEVPTDAPTALVVDDMGASRSLMSTMLGVLGFKVITAATGDEALRLAARNPFRLIMLDAVMPGIDGFETARRLREISSAKRRADLAIVGCTALDAVAERQRALDAGMDGLLAKPLTMAALKAELAKHGVIPG